MYKIGVIGLGRRIANGVLPPLHDCSNDVIVTAVADTDENIKDRIAEKPELYADDVKIYKDADDMLANEELNGIIIGTRCNLHTDMAIKAMKKGVPILLEKPVCTNEAELGRLNDAAKKYKPQVMVAFGLRFTPITSTVKEIIDSGKIGDIIQVDAWNDVPYGGIYFHHWYRDENLTGGLWLQKATHDFDLINCLLDDTAEEVFAMENRTIFKGNMPAGLKCADCEKNRTCIESPYVTEHIRHDQVKGEYCCFAKDTGNHDCATALVKYSKGTIVKYHQNFFARHKAVRRGARVYGYKGTLEFDWYTNQIKLYNHFTPRLDTFEYYGDEVTHFGGDQVLVAEFIDMMDGKTDATYIYEGMQSANMCLSAKKSCETGTKVAIPKL